MTAPAPGLGAVARLRAAGAALRGRRARRLMAAVAVAAGGALLMVDPSRLPDQTYEVGEVAERDLRASMGFDFVDEAATDLRRSEAEAQVLPVYDFHPSAAGEVSQRVGLAFDAARRRSTDALLQAQSQGRDDLSDEERSAIALEFVRELKVSLDPEDIELVSKLRYSREVEQQARRMLEAVMQGYVVTDRSVLPAEATAITLVTFAEDAQAIERVLSDLRLLRTPAEARQDVSLYALENADANDPTVKSGVALARAAVQPNLFFNQRDTTMRRARAREDVDEIVIRVHRGAPIARAGEALSAQQVAQLAAMSPGRSRGALAGLVLAMVGLVGLVTGALHSFTTSHLTRAPLRTRDIEAGAVLLLLVLGLARLVMQVSEPLAAALGPGASAAAFWLMVPAAGGAMLLRVLVHAEAALIWTVATACLLGLMMDQQVLYAVYFAVSGVAAAGAVGGSQERVGVLRAGLLAGLVNAAAALLIALTQVHLVEGVGQGIGALPIWEVLYALFGGLLSAFLVLGLVPVFEQFGFVTDYRLLELANLNHPLLRQLMLRAPGTYHHSVTVAQLSEAAAEAIGANALQVRVACYFHDIGKAVNPKYFIENQRGGPNPHDRLPPRASARVILNHVTDGEAIAKQYNLPQPVIDGISMHHGTGLIQYFYVRAKEAAKDGDEVKEADFRYPGRLPNTREAGIMMLADKVEAATRTLKDKSPASIRGLIQKLTNSTLTDGQLEQCPLTVKEIYTIIDAFTETLLGIYHHRIEYPGIPRRGPPEADGERPTGPVITLEISNPFIPPPAQPSAPAPAPLPLLAADDPGGLPTPVRGEPSIHPEDDYESADHLGGPPRAR